MKLLRSSASTTTNCNDFVNIATFFYYQNNNNSHMLTWNSFQCILPLVVMNDDPQSVVYISVFCFYVTVSFSSRHYTIYIFHAVMTQYSQLVAKAVMQSLRPGSWSRGASRTKMKVAGSQDPSWSRGALNIWCWSWSRSWRKSLAVFQDFCSNSWLQWARHTMAFCETTKAVCHSEAIVSGCAPCTSASVERVFNNLFVRPHRCQ